MVTTAQIETLTIETGDLVYRFEGNLGELYPVGLFAEGIRFHNQFEGKVVAGPFEGARIFGLDQFMLRPDGIGVIVAPETSTRARSASRSTCAATWSRRPGCRYPRSR